MGLSRRAQLRTAGINEGGINRGRSYSLYLYEILRHVLSTQAIRQQTLTEIMNQV